MKKLRAERVERMEEAKSLGDNIERIKEAKSKVQAALEALKVKLREAESQAAIDPGGAAQNTVTTLRELLATEEPKLVQLLNEKQQRYELDYSRLSELKRELAHLKHGEEKLSAAIQTEFAHWRQAVEERYPGCTKPAAVSQSPVAAGAGSCRTSPSPAPSGRTSPSGPPPPMPRTQSSPSAASTPAASAASTPAAAAPAMTSVASIPGQASSPQVDRASAKPAEPSPALAKAEAALRSLRDRLEEARQSGDLHRQQMLEQLLSVEEPRLARLRTESAV